MKFLLLLVVLLCCSVFAASETAYFAMKTHGSHHDFIIKLDDKDKIEKARNLVSGKDNEKLHVMGRIKKTAKDYNPHYSFHLDPATITFFDMAIEVCDATLPYVEENLDEACGAFLPGCFYCPWSSQLTREVKI